MLALDIGIKHLAYCSATKDASGCITMIKHWSLVNLTDLNNTEKPVCVQCGKPAKARGHAGLVCGKHVPKGSQIFDEGTGKPIKKQPTIAQLQAFLRAKGLESSGKGRAALVERAGPHMTLPLVKVKSAMSFADNTCNLHDAIRAWIDRDWSYLSECKDVYIEHQPVLKNPVMKTVQLLIFATLRDRYISSGATVAFHFVHAGKKVKAAAGDAGYKDRKAGGEARVKEWLSKHCMEWLPWWLAQPKRDDLADTLCMILDHCQTNR